MWLLPPMPRWGWLIVRLGFPGGPVPPSQIPYRTRGFSCQDHYNIKMSGAYAQLLDRLETVADDPKRLIYDPELNALLTALRTEGPIRVVCGKRSCSQTISWWALDPEQLAMVLSAKRRKTKKESSGLGGVYEFVDPDPHPLHGFRLSEREAMDPDQHGRKRVVLADDPNRGVTGVVTRRVFICGKCGREYPRKNETMLRDFVKAADARRREIIL